MSAVHLQQEKVPIPKTGSLKLPAIQVMRGVAASLVVVAHFATALQEYGNRPSWISNSGLGFLGNAGVDLFFVISGFIMVYTTTRKAGPGDAVDFLKKRALRIYPLYWVWTTFVLVLWGSGFALKTHHYSASYIIQSYFLIPVWSGQTFQPLLSQGWTLMFELLFYAVFACGIVIHFARWRPIFLTIGFAILGGIGMLLPPHTAFQYLLSEPIIIEFLFGVIAAEVVLRLRERRSEPVSKLVPALLFVVAAAGILLSLTYHYPAWARFLVWGLPALCAVMGAALLGSTRQNAFLVFLGDASYSIYLTHGFFSAGYAMGLKHIAFLKTLPSDPMIIVLAVVSIGAGSLTYRFVERPLTAALSGGKKREQGIARPDEIPVAN